MIFLFELKLLQFFTTSPFNSLSYYIVLSFLYIFSLRRLTGTDIYLLVIYSNNQTSQKTNIMLLACKQKFVSSIMTTAKIFFNSVDVD